MIDMPISCEFFLHTTINVYQLFTEIAFLFLDIDKPVTEALLEKDGVCIECRDENNHHNGSMKTK